MANQIDGWLQQRIGSVAAAEHRSEIKRVKWELQKDKEILVDAVPVQVGRVGSELLVITNRRLFTVSRSINVPLRAVGEVSVRADGDDPVRFVLSISTPEKRIPLRVHNTYRDSLLASLQEVAPPGGSMPERARSFVQKEKEKEKKTKELRAAEQQKKLDEDTRLKSYFALGASIVAYFFWYVHWVPVVAAGVTMFAWSRDESSKQRSVAGRGALVIASVISAVNLFVVGVDLGIIQ